MKKEANQEARRVLACHQRPDLGLRRARLLRPWDSFLKRLKEAGVDDDGVDDVRRDPPGRRVVARTYRLLNGGGAQAIYAPKKIPTSTLIHELYHVTYGILDAKGVCSDDEEAFAYTLDWLYKEATK